MRKKIIPVIVALILMAIVGIVGFGGKLWEKYSYGKELADLDAYYGVETGQLAIILQDEMIDEKAVMEDGVVYFDLDLVHNYFNEGFYADLAEGKLLYTTADDTVTALFGTMEYSDINGGHSTEYTICRLQGDTLYLAADFVKLFTNYSYDVYDRHLQVYTQWGEVQTMEVTKDTQIRILGGIKSPILRELEKGETVVLLDEMEDWETEDWCKVKTSDSIIGYVESKRMKNPGTENRMPVTDYVPAEYTSIAMPGKVSLGFHSIGGVGGNATLGEMAAEGQGMNVIAPTWFSITDNEGNFRSFASGEYVQEAHGYGLQVWGVWDNFNYKNETGTDISSYQVLSSTTNRQMLVQNIVNTSMELGLDGVNIDFEGLTEECGVHYVQFLRELSVLCRRSGLVLSVDNYVPFHFNNFYRLDIQGQVADYVIIMGYDEHWITGGEPGSVASLGYVSNGLDKTLEQVPAQKVVNALPFYTILWTTQGVNVTGQYITLQNVGDYLQRMNAETVWDAEACQNYAEWQSGEATYQIWVEDEESIAVKLDVMKVKEIGGVAVWRLGYGTPGAWSLIAAYVGS